MTVSPPKFKTIFYRTLLMTAALLSVTACGIKPGGLQQPSGNQAPQFPAAYPR